MRGCDGRQALGDQRHTPLAVRRRRRTQDLTVVTAALVTFAVASPVTMASPAAATRPGTPGYAYTANATSRTVSVVRLDATAVTGTIPVPSGAEDIALSERRGRAYVTGGSQSDRVSVIDTEHSRVIATIRAGRRPLGVAVTGDGSRALVTNADSDTVSLIDTGRNKVVKTLHVGDWPRDVAITPDGRRAYVTNLKSDSVSVIDIRSSRIVETVRFEKDTAAYAVAIAPDGRRAYVSGGNGVDTVTVIDTRTNEIADTVRIGQGAESLVVTPDSSRVYVSSGFRTGDISVIDTGLLAVSHVFHVPYGAEGMAIGADGTRLFVAGGHDRHWMTLVNAETDRVIRSVRVGWSPLSVARETPRKSAS